MRSVGSMERKRDIQFSSQEGEGPRRMLCNSHGIGRLRVVLLSLWLCRRAIGRGKAVRASGIAYVGKPRKHSSG